jgi:hypothetical protein
VPAKPTAVRRKPPPKEPVLLPPHAGTEAGATFLVAE